MIVICKWPDCTAELDANRNTKQGCLCPKHRRMRQLAPVKRIYAHTPAKELKSALLKFEALSYEPKPRRLRGKIGDELYELGLGWHPPSVGCWSCAAIQECRQTRRIWCRPSSIHQAQLRQMSIEIGDGV